MTSADVVIRSFGTHAASETTVWSGAGISMDGPSSLPSGWELTNRLFANFFLPDALATILAHHRNIGWLDRSALDGSLHDRVPRLETVLGVAKDIYGLPALDILGDMRVAPPNAVHQMLAAHLHAGGRHLTANFDGCIEATGSSANPVPVERIEHFHGSFAADPTGASLGATLKAIEQGFRHDMAERFSSFLTETAACVVVGYSGSDFFDVDPLVASMAPVGTLDGRKVLWVLHDPLRFEILSDLDSLPPVVSHLHAAGAHVEVVAAPTREVIGRLVDAWGLSKPSLGSSSVRALRSVTVPATAEQRTAATFRLFNVLGIHAEVAAMLRRPLPASVTDEERWAARSSLLWEAGRWSALRQAWRRRPPSVERDERIGACLWEQGRYLPAYTWLRYKAWRRRGNEQERLALYETTGRVVEHMSRVPDLRWLGRRLAPSVVAALGPPTSRDGIQTWRRREDLYTSLTAIAGRRHRPTKNAETTSRWFEESGSLSGALSYQHRALRDASSAIDGDRPRGPAYLAQMGRANALGSRTGAWRVVLLPGSEEVFGPREVIAHAFILQYGWWHRIRLIGDFVWRRLSN